MAERELEFSGPDPNTPGPFQEKVRQAFADARLNRAFFEARVANAGNRNGCAVVVDDGRIITAVRKRSNETPKQAEIRAEEKALYRIGLGQPFAAVTHYVPTRKERRLLS